MSELPEETYLDMMDQELLKNAYEINTKPRSESYGDSHNQIIAHPYQLESHASFNLVALSHPFPWPLPLPNLVSSKVIGFLASH